MQCAATSCRNVACKSVMAICRFCLSKVRRKFEWYYLLYLSVAMQTHPCYVDVLYCHQLFVLPCQFWLSNLTEGTRHTFVELEYNFCDSVLYGRATRTSIAVVSKFPRKAWGAMHVHTVDATCFSPIFVERLGTSLGLGSLKVN